MTRLDDFIVGSQRLGHQEALVQGAGGNTSVKLDARRMAVKASGRKLRDLAPGRGYVIVNIPALLTELAVVDDPDPVVRENSLSGRLRQTIIGESAERPSMETALHALLPTHVVHTHAIYVNVLTCSVGGQARLESLFGHEQPMFIPYVTPGYGLAAAVAAIVAEREPEAPIFLMNHGLITASDDAKSAYAQTRDINEACWMAIHDTLPNWPRFHLDQLTAHMMGGEPYSRSRASIVGNYLRSLTRTEELIEQCCFPDAVVFCARNVLLTSAEHRVQAVREVKELTGVLPSIVVVPEHGIFYRGSLESVRSVQAIFEAYLYLQATIQALGGTVIPLTRSEQQILLDVESEKYRIKVGVAA